MPGERPAGNGVGAGRKCRIAHLQLLPLLSGVQRVTLEEVTRLDPARFEPTVICKEEGPLTEALKAWGIPYYCVPELVREISPIQDLKALIRLRRIFREGRFDVVHTHSSKTGVLGRLAGKWAGVPRVVHTVHGFAFPAAKNPLEKTLYYSLEWLGARMTDALIVLNRNDRRLALEKLRMDGDRTFLVPNGVDPAVYKPLDGQERERIRREVFGLGSGQTALGMVGRLWRQKNPECLVRAAIRLLGKDRNKLRFFFLGDGEERARLEGLIREAGFEREVRILGWRRDVAELLGGLDIFTLPSSWEGMPLAILEAMAAGLPAVVSDIPGNRDLVEDGVTGLLFPAGDWEALADRLERVAAEPGSGKEWGAAGRKKTLDSHSLEGRVKRMEWIYSGSVEGRA